jgi:hypothetical protein
MHRRALLLLVVLAGCGGDRAVPYDEASLQVDAVRSAFAREDVALQVRAAGGPITGLGDREHVLEVAVFGDPAEVRATGFEDLDRGPSCSSANRLALRWHRNLRVIVDCARTGRPSWWLAKIERVFARLG